MVIIILCGCMDANHSHNGSMRHVHVDNNNKTYNSREMHGYKPGSFP